MRRHWISTIDGYMGVRLKKIVKRGTSDSIDHPPVLPYHSSCLSTTFERLFKGTAPEETPAPTPKPVENPQPTPTPTDAGTPEQTGE